MKRDDRGGGGRRKSFDFKRGESRGPHLLTSFKRRVTISFAKLKSKYFLSFQVSLIHLNSLHQPHHQGLILIRNPFQDKESEIRLLNFTKNSASQKLFTSPFECLSPIIHPTSTSFAKPKDCKTQLAISIHPSRTQEESRSEWIQTTGASNATHKTHQLPQQRATVHEEPSSLAPTGVEVSHRVHYSRVHHHVMGSESQ